MKQIFTIISLMFFAFSIAEAQQNNISLNEFKTQNPDLDHFHSIDNHHYFIKDELISWTDAKNYGDQIGVSMYIINSSDEENEVYTNLPLSGNNGFGYLIGLYQDTNDNSYSEPDGGWKWVDGTSLTYENWETNEPNNANNGEDYAQFDWQGGGLKWNDIASSPNVNKAIYEFVDSSANILLNGTVSAENNQIKNVADPTNAQDVATKNYVDNVGIQGPAGPAGPIGPEGPQGPAGTSPAPKIASYKWHDNRYNIVPDQANFIPLDLELINTDSSVFELINSGNGGSANWESDSTGSEARIKVNESGWYEIVTMAYYYDLGAGRHLITGIYKSVNDSSPLQFQEKIQDHKFANNSTGGADSRQTAYGHTIIYLNSGECITYAVRSNHGLYPERPNKITIRKL